jgi:oligosaccharide reducing-end xylanase
VKESQSFATGGGLVVAAALLLGSCGGGTEDSGAPAGGSAGIGGKGSTAGRGGNAGRAPGGSAGKASGSGGTGAVPGTGTNTENLFTSLIGKSEAEVSQKVTTAVNRFFGIGTGEPNTLTADSGYRCYYELPQDPSMAFIWAADSNDVRSEGLSYGMMIAVQMDLHAEFDKLWKFSKTYVQYPANGGMSAWKYYFKFQGTVNASSASSWSVSYGTSTPAPDGDEYFAAALYLADQRWGSSGGVNYKQEADNIATAMLHNAPTNDSRFPIIHASRNMVVFVPYGSSNEFTDPSYHLPGFYEVFALYGPAADRAKWQSVAETSRAFLVSSAHATTGLHPDYASFTGAPRTGTAGDGHDQFRYDAWRVVLNMAVDYAWFSADPRMQTQVEKYHAFFGDKLGANNVQNSLFHVDGSSPDGGSSTALTGTLAAGALASSAANRATYVTNLWNDQQKSGTYRYYQEGVYLLALLAASGNFRYVF